MGQPNLPFELTLLNDVAVNESFRFQCEVKEIMLHVGLSETIFF